MKTVQVVLDDDLLKEADRVARSERCNRSALVRAALREYLARRRIAEMDERDRKGYERRPVGPGEFDAWDPVAERPED